MLRVENSHNRGRGVFANRKINAGEIIEDAPVIIISAIELENLKRTDLYRYFFQWNCEQGECGAICLGLGSIYNHSPTPNAKYIRIFEKKIIRFITLKPIHKDEEVLTNYNGNSKNKSPLWFENEKSIGK